MLLIIVVNMIRRNGVPFVHSCDQRSGHKSKGSVRVTKKPNPGCAFLFPKMKPKSGEGR